MRCRRAAQQQDEICIRNLPLVGIVLIFVGAEKEENLRFALFLCTYVCCLFVSGYPRLTASFFLSRLGLDSVNKASGKKKKKTVVRALTGFKTEKLGNDV